MNHSYQWIGREDGDGEEHFRFFNLVNQHEFAEYAIIGFSSDEGVKRNKGRIGASLAPDLIRKQLANLPVHQIKNIKDVGNVVCQNEDLEHAQSELATQVDLTLQAGLKPIVLGGGHEVAYGSFSGLFSYLKKSNNFPKVGIINFDAHFDLREDIQATSGTPFLQAANLMQSCGQAFRYLCIGVAKHANTKKLFDTAHDLGCEYIFDKDVIFENINKLTETLDAFIASIDVLYLTIDLDVFTASIAPGVSAPAVKGIDLKVFDVMFEHVVKTGKVKLIDVAECNPNYDQDHLTSKLAAYIIYRYIFEGLV